MYCLENTMKTILRQSAPLVGFLKESQEIDDRVRLVYFNREIRFICDTVRIYRCVVVIPMKVAK